MLAAIIVAFLVGIASGYYFGRNDLAAKIEDEIKALEAKGEADLNVARRTYASLLAAVRKHL